MTLFELLKWFCIAPLLFMGLVVLLGVLLAPVLSSMVSQSRGEE